ncbi:MAG: hypothetical protein HYZ81_20765 [Nitrospinae bacterium]|nr:hypothetical protein [Nitrospinota bacterium]
MEGLALAVSPVVVIGAVVTASIMRATQRRPGMRHAAVRGGVAAMIIVSVAIVGLVAWEAYKGEKDSREILANAQATADMQVFGGSIRAAFAAYAAESPGKRYPSEDLIRDYAMLRALLEPEGMRVPEPDRLTGFTVHSYQLLDADGDGVPESYQLVLSAVSPRILGKRSPSHTLVLTPESVSVVRGDAEGKTTR